MSEIAGISAILIAAELLATARGGKGVLLGGIAGVPPAKVIILGAGVVAEFATRTASAWAPRCVFSTTTCTN
jgi:alanine dehydrogenase